MAEAQKSAAELEADRKAKETGMKDKTEDDMVKAAQQMDVNRINTISAHKGDPRYYKSAAPTFNTIFRSRTTGEKYNVNFENGYYKTDNKLIQEFLDINFVSRGIIFACTESEYKEKTALVEGVKGQGPFSDVAATVLNPPPHSVNPFPNPEAGRVGAQQTIKTGQSSSAQVVAPVHSVAGQTK